MPVMENCRLKVSSILDGIASFVNQLMEMIVGLKVEQGIHGAGPVVRNDFELFDTNAVLILGVSNDLATVAHR